MTARPLEDYQPQDAPDDAKLAAWLDRVSSGRDLTLPAPGGLDAEALLGFFFTISSELNELAAVVTGALGAASRDAESLTAIVASTSEHEQGIRETASAINEAAVSATHVAQTDEALRRVVSGAFTATDEAATEFEAIRSSLAGLGLGLEAGVTPLQTMDEAVRGVGSFLAVLKKMSRQAQLLGVNASVEASHIGEAGARFAIVASEVRKLAGSTRASCDDISRLIGELARATDRLTAATREAQSATDEATLRIDAASKNLLQGHGSLERVEEIVESIASIATQQSTSLHNVVASIEEISRHASGVSKASADAAALDIFGVLQEAERSAQAWRVLGAAHAPPGERTPFARWLTALLAGRDPAESFEGELQYPQVARSLRATLDALNRDERATLAHIVRANVAAARNSFSWQSIASSLDALRSEIGNVALAVDQSVKAARTAAETSASMRLLVEE
ncbi:MAG TPA: methyl-accepting chemotaxis protein, partial [Candidatus Acidoferrum sp.]|nr:methyl-accepting chemotaxis protein [Candidatus Acidoferrum sp.]